MRGAVRECGVPSPKSDVITRATCGHHCGVPSRGTSPRLALTIITTAFARAGGAPPTGASQGAGRHQLPAVARPLGHCARKQEVLPFFFPLTPSPHSVTPPPLPLSS